MHKKLKRWILAQEYEKKFWNKRAKDIESGIIKQLSWYAWKAAELENKLKDAMDFNKEDKINILEIGSGPVGIVSYLTFGERYAIDPLEDFYNASPTLVELRDPLVIYDKGCGESISFEDETFALVIIDNVLDHTNFPEKVVREIHRVLKNNGLLYQAVNIRTRWGRNFHRVLSSLYIDKGHPHSFTEESIRSLLLRNNFKIEKEEVDDYLEVKRSNCKGKELKDKIKGYTGISEYQYQALCRK